MSARDLQALTAALAVLNDATARLLAGDTGAATLAAGARALVRRLAGGAK